jgi:hypothetical protein
MSADQTVRALLPVRAASVSIFWYAYGLPSSTIPFFSLRSSTEPTTAYATIAVGDSPRPRRDLGILWNPLKAVSSGGMTL